MKYIHAFTSVMIIITVFSFLSVTCSQSNANNKSDINNNTVTYTPTSSSQQDKLSESQDETQSSEDSNRNIHVKSEIRNISISIQGELEAIQTVKLGPETGGEIKEISVEVGDRVYKNKNIASIYSAMLETQLLQLDQQINQAQRTAESTLSSISEMETQKEIESTNLQNTLRTFQRLQSASTVIARQDLENSQGQLDVIQKKLEMVDKQLSTSQLRYKQQLTQKEELLQQKKDLLGKIERLTITSPIDGLVLKRHVSEGEFCSPAPAGVIVTIIQADPLKFVFSVPEIYTNIITTDPKKVQLYLPTLQDKPFELSRIVPEINDNSRRLTLEVNIPNPNHQLILGQFIKGKLSLELEGIFLSKSAIYYNSIGEPYVLRKNGESSMQIPIQLGIEEFDYAKVISGIQAGDEILLP